MLNSDDMFVSMSADLHRAAGPARSSVGLVADRGSLGGGRDLHNESMRYTVL